MNFIEVTLSSNRNITINIAFISNFFPTSVDNKCTIAMGEEDIFTVNHTYEEVKGLILKNQEVKIFSLTEPSVTTLEDIKERTRYPSIRP